jgi:hypothetical protein
MNNIIIAGPSTLNSSYSALDDDKVNQNATPSNNLEDISFFNQ